MSTMPHCDSAVLHAPGECEYCDKYKDWQHVRQMWGIAFTGHPAKDGELPCPSEVRRTQDVIEAWPGNRPSLNSAFVTSHDVPHFRPTIPPPDSGITQLGRPNIPVLRKDLEVLVREIIDDVLHERANDRRNRDH